MRGRLYWVVRDLHLYLGLFISPFILVFSVSVFFLVHAWRPGMKSEVANTRVVSAVALPADWKSLSGRPLVDALKPVVEQAGVRGEIGFVRHAVLENQLIIPVSIPGRETTVTINTTNFQASVATRETGLSGALITLHKSPGGHGPGIRMNWFFAKAWLWFADATAYLTFFISVSGVYLWCALRAERRVGIVLLVAGALTFFGIAYALSS
jgi:hypothetical protein